MSAWRRPYRRDRDRLPAETIETERLLLRPVRKGDGADFFDMDGDARVADAVPVERVTDREAYLEEFVREFAAGRFAHFLALVPKDNAETCMGWVFLRPTEDGEWVELGYRLAHAHWGQGYVPEAAAALIDMAFDRLGLDRVMAMAVPENRNSKRVMEKLGFSYVETTQEDGYTVERFMLEKRATVPD